MKKMNLLTTHNVKLGNMVAFSITPVITCPGKSKWCEKYCYSKKLEKIRKSCRIAWENNYIFSQGPEFVEKINLELKYHDRPYCRVHVSGDFYINEYIQKWIDIAKNNPTIKFFSFTRSYRIPELVEKLEELKDMENVSLLASVDPSHDYIPQGWKLAIVNEKRERTIKSFPINDEYQRVVSDSIHCLEEKFIEDNGLTYKQIKKDKIPIMTCSKCKVCIQGKKNVHFNGK